MTSDFIVDVSENNFEFEVLSFSQNVLVVVDFWAVWCRPCKTLSPLLEKLAHEAHGAFRLARVDADQNPNLALRFNVRSLPTVKAFVDGQVVGEFAGVVSEERLREFMGKLTPPSPLNLAIEKAEGLFYMRQWANAEKMYRALLEQAPGQPACLLGLAQSLLPQGKGAEARYILADFPDSRQLARAELLRPLAEAIFAHEQDQLPAETDLDAAFQNSIRLAGRGNLDAALDGLLEILRADKHYRGEKARQVILGILELLDSEDPRMRQYRSELASILF